MRKFKATTLVLFLLGLLCMYQEWAGAYNVIGFSMFLASIAFLSDALRLLISKGERKILGVLWKSVCLLWVVLFLFKYMYWWPWLYIQFVTYLFTLSAVSVAATQLKRTRKLLSSIKADKWLLPLLLVAVVGCLVPHSTLIFASEIYFDGRMDDHTRYLESRCATYRRYTYVLEREGKLKELEAAEAEEFKYCNLENSGIEIFNVDKDLLQKIAANSDTSFTDTTGYTSSKTKLTYYLNQKTGDTTEVLRDSLNRITFIGWRRNGTCLLSAEYYTNGQVRCRTIPDADIASENYCHANGIRRCYYADGRISSEGEFKNGTKSGIWKSFDEYGNPVLIELFNEQGEVVRRWSRNSQGL